MSVSLDLSAMPGNAFVLQIVAGLIAVRMAAAEVVGSARPALPAKVVFVGQYCGGIHRPGYSGKLGHPKKCRGKMQSCIATL